MGNQLPETVKIARADLAGVTALVGTPFPMNLGVNEVAILLSFYWSAIGTPVAGTNLGYIGLWRKTDADPAAIMVVHTDMIWSLRVQILHVAETVRSSWHEHVILPWPLILIRAPRLIGLSDTFTAVTIQMRLFYTIQKVSDEELAKLMVKDHA